MYLIKDKERLAFIPCDKISWVADDTYICKIPYEEDITDPPASLFVSSEFIFEVDIYRLAQDLVKSKKIDDKSKRHILYLMEVKSIDGSVCELWFIYNGGLSDGVASRDTNYFTEFHFPKNILRHDRIVAVRDPVFPSGRVILKPADGEPRKREDVISLGRRHKEILSYISLYGNSTTFQVAEGLRIPVSSASGRISELVRLGHLICVTSDTSSGTPRKVWGDKHNESWI